MVIPKKLKKGDEIRVLMTARSLGILSKEVKDLAVSELNKLGFKVSFGKYCSEMDEFNSTNIEHRISDLEGAFLDKNIKMILPVIGGFNSNQLLKSLDYSIIKKNPKIFGGFSDNTAMQNAIFAKTGMLTYSTPNFSSFGTWPLEYTISKFRACVTSDKPYELEPSKEWDNSHWGVKAEERKLMKNEGHWIIHPGTAKGRIIGANLCTFNLLQGTEFMPGLSDAILFLEDDSESNPVAFDRDLQSLIHQPEFEKVKGVIIGRFEIKSEITRGLLTKIIETKRELKSLPVIANVDFGHTEPKASFPIGGTVEFKADSNKTKITIKEH